MQLQQIVSLARWLAHKAIKEKWRAQGRKLNYVPVMETAAEANTYFIQHREELIEAARAHPVTIHFQQERLRLARTQRTEGKINRTC